MTKTAWVAMATMLGALSAVATAQPYSPAPAASAASAAEIKPFRRHPFPLKVYPRNPTEADRRQFEADLEAYEQCEADYIKKHGTPRAASTRQGFRNTCGEKPFWRT